MVYDCENYVRLSKYTINYRIFVFVASLKYVLNIRYNKCSINFC